MNDIEVLNSMAEQNDDKMVGAFIVADKEQFYKNKESEDKQ